MSYRNCDTIFAESQETNKNLNLSTPPFKKIFQSNEITFPQAINKSNFQTPQTKNISLCNSEQKSFLKFQSQNSIGNLNNLAQNLFKTNTNNQKQEIEEIKPCNCRKSKCLKLYCDCFAAGKLCSSKCNCCGCFNNSSNLLERNLYMKKTEERNPEAFIQKVKEVDYKLAHSKGCNCRKSGCKKKYCECYQMGIECSDNCKCDGCKNCSSNKLVKIFTQQDISQFSRQLKQLSQPF